MLLIGAVAIVFQIIRIQIQKPDQRIVDALTPASIEKSIEPKRGRIIDSQGRILALSCPEYQFFIDCTVMKAESDTSKQEIEWHRKARLLAEGLSKEFETRVRPHTTRHFQTDAKTGKIPENRHTGRSQHL